MDLNVTEINPLELTESQRKELFFEEHMVDSFGNDLLEVVETTDWTDEGKYSDAEVIFKDLKTGLHYRYGIIRSGSYFSHYEYESYDKPELVEKQKRTITVEEWVAI
jgi:hypothetical protein